MNITGHFMSLEIDDTTGAPTEADIQEAMKKQQWPNFSTDGPVNYTGIFFVTLAACILAQIIFWSMA